MDFLVAAVKQYIDSWQTFDELMQLIQELDIFITAMPVTFDTKVLEVLNQLPIRNAWYGGKSLKEITTLF